MSGQLLDRGSQLLLQAVSLKAELEALRGNCRRAGKLVTARGSDVGSVQGLEDVQMLCNMGYVQHVQGKHHTAVLCYSKALKAAAQSRAPLLPLVHLHCLLESHSQEQQACLLCCQRML